MNKELDEKWWFCKCDIHFVHPISQKFCPICRETLEEYREYIKNKNK